MLFYKTKCYKCFSMCICMLKLDITQCNTIHSFKQILNRGYGDLETYSDDLSVITLPCNST